MCAWRRLTAPIWSLRRSKVDSGEIYHVIESYLLWPEQREEVKDINEWARCFQCVGNTTVHPDTQEQYHIKFDCEIWLWSKLFSRLSQLSAPLSLEPCHAIAPRRSWDPYVPSSTNKGPSFICFSWALCVCTFWPFWSHHFGRSFLSQVLLTARGWEVGSCQPAITFWGIYWGFKMQNYVGASGWVSQKHVTT